MVDQIQENLGQIEKHLSDLYGMWSFMKMTTNLGLISKI